VRGNFRSCLIFLVLSYVPFANQVTPIINAIFFLNVMLSIWQENQNRRIPQLIRVGLMLMGLALIFNEYQSLWGLEPGVAALSLMATLKIFELHGKRDFFLFVLIVELSLIGHVLTVDQLYMVIYVIVISLLLFGLLFTYHMGDKSAKWSKARRKVFAQIFLYSIPLAVGFFLLFPRLTLGNLFFNTVRKQNLTGFSDEVRPGTIAKVIQNKTTYFRAKFLDNKTPSYFELYWRGSILSKTDGFTWTRVKPPGKRVEDLVGPIKYRYEITYDAFMNSPLFLLEDTTSFDKSSKGYLLNMGAGTFKFYPYSNQKISFSGETGRRIPKSMSAPLREHYLQLPPTQNMTKFFSWVKGLTFKNSQLRTYSKTFSEWLKKDGFTYSLSPGILMSKAPIDEFFFSSKKGFCEHYAASFALYLRLLGVPSRIVVGFHGGEFNPLGQYYIVKGLDAHAWVEAWDEKKGWLRFDPTGYVSPDRIRYGSNTYFLNDQEREGVSLDVYLERKSGEFWQGLKFAMDMLYYEANREFVGYDLDRQENLFKFLGTKGKKWPWKLLALCFGLTSLFLIPLFLQLKKSLRARNPYIRAYRRFLKKLNSAGLETPSWQGPVELKRRSIELYPSQRKELEEVFELFMKGVYREPSSTLKVNKKASDSEYLKFRDVINNLNLRKVNQKSM